MRWQQRLRIGIAAFGHAFLGLLYFQFRASKPAGTPGGAPGVTREEPDATAQSTSGELLNLLRVAENFRLEYDKLFTYPTRISFACAFCSSGQTEFSEALQHGTAMMQRAIVPRV